MTYKNFLAADFAKNKFWNLAAKTIPKNESYVSSFKNQSKFSFYPTSVAMATRRRTIDRAHFAMVFLCFFECCRGNVFNLNIIVILEFIIRDIYLLFEILFFSKFQNSFFLQTHEAESRP